jgi:hypothetical protein
MVGSLKRLTQLSQWKPQARERALWVAIVAGPLAMLMSVLLLGVTLFAISRSPKPVNVYRSIADTQRVEQKLLERKADEQSLDLSVTGFEVYNITPVDIERYPGTDAVEWVVTMAVSRVVPGADGTPRTNTYVVTLLERDSNLQLLTLPRIVNPEMGRFTVDSSYTVAVDKKGPLGKSLEGFLSAYLTGGQGVSLRDYVSAGFTDPAISGSPYRSVEVEWIRAVSGTKDVSAGKPGDSVSALARVKASASQDTWTVMDFPVRMSMADNGNWWVDGFDSPLRWGKIGK